MSRESYERPKGITFGVDRTFKEVAQPWLETGKRSLKASEAEFVCTVCHHHCLLAHDGFRDEAKRFADLLRDHPEEVGRLIVLVAKWHAKQIKTKLGRARLAVEIAMTRHREKTLDFKLVLSVAKAEGINLNDVSQEYIRGRLNDIRREVEDDRTRLETFEARKFADAWVDATLAKKGQSLTQAARDKTKSDRAQRAAAINRSKQIRKMNAR
jgi:hypothetical protein